VFSDKRRARLVMRQRPCVVCPAEGGPPHQTCAIETYSSCRRECCCGARLHRCHPVRGLPAECFPTPSGMGVVMATTTTIVCPPTVQVTTLCTKPPMLGVGALSQESLACQQSPCCCHRWG